MNGVALLLAVSALGVDYDVRTAEDGKLEYVVQMEPELLKSLADGQQIHSAVPASAGNIERIIVRVGMSEPKHSQTNKLVYQNLLVEASRIASTDGRGVGDMTASILWPAKSKPELNYNVKYGWQPDAQGLLSYYVQVDPTLLQQLAIGDEIRAGIEPAAGTIGRFVIQVGSKDLPKIPVEPAASVRTEGGSGRTRFAPSTSTSTSDLYPSATKSTYGPSPSTLAPVQRPAVPLASTPDYSSAAATAPEQQPLYAPPPRTPSRFSSGVSDGGASLGPPKFDAHTDYGQGQSLYGDQRYAPPAVTSTAPPRGVLEPPPATQYGPSNYATSSAAQAPQLQTQFQPQTNYAPSTNYAPPTNYAPAPTPQDRLANVNRPAAATNVAAPLAAPQINPTGATKSSAETSDNKPYLTMIVTFALFMSIGANLYLGWTAGEYYSRYRLATERLRSASRT
jgi:hypothetical protein